MNGFSRVVISLTLSVALIGCAPQGPTLEIPPGTAYVRLGNGGSIFGGSTTTIYDGDVVTFVSSDGTEESIREGFVTLRAGGFARIRSATIAIIENAPTSPAEPGCMDYGTDLIEVFDGERVLTRLSASCPENDVRAAQAAVRRVLDAEIAE